MKKIGIFIILLTLFISACGRNTENGYDEDDLIYETNGYGELEPFVTGNHTASLLQMPYFTPTWDDWFGYAFTIWGSYDVIVITAWGNNSYRDIRHGHAWAPADSIFNNAIILPSNNNGMGINMQHRFVNVINFTEAPVVSIYNITTDTLVLEETTLLRGEVGFRGFMIGNTYRVFGHTGYEPFSFYVVVGNYNDIIENGLDAIYGEEGPVREPIICCYVNEDGILGCVAAWQNFTSTREPMTYAQRLRAENTERFTPNIQTFSENGNEIRVVLLAEDVVRIRVGSNGHFPNDYNPYFAVVKTDDMWRGAIDLDPNPNIINTGAMQIHVSYNPMTLNIFDGNGNVLIEDWVIDFTTQEADWVLGDDENVFGFGDVRSSINKREMRIETRNSDTIFHFDQANTGYKVIPMYWSSRGYGVFLHNTWPGVFDFGLTTEDRINISANGGEMDFYFFAGPEFTNIVDNYTRLTGRPAMLPRWVLGFHQGGASNRTSQNYAIYIAQNMRANNLPIDVIFYDDYWPSIFTPQFICRMNNEFNVEISIGLGMPYDAEGSRIWNRLNDLDPNGLIVGLDGLPVLYDPNSFGGFGRTEFDFFSDIVSDTVFDTVWRAPLQAGAWNGMLDFGEMDYVPDPENTFFPSFDPPRTVAEMANVYSLIYFEQLVTRAAALRNSRYVGMPRAGWAGSQRYGWTFTGDSAPEWGGSNGLQANLRSVLNLTMSGFSNVGTDAGGWTGAATNTLFARWFQVSMFMPYAAIHSLESPTIFGRHAGVMDIARDALNRRYQFLPYMYSLMFHAHMTGTPMIRTLAFETNAAPGTERINNQFFFGSSIMVAPFVTINDSREIFFPEGTWVCGNDFITVFQGNTIVEYFAPLEKVPFFYKAGAIVPSGPIMQFTSELPLNPLTIDYIPSHLQTSFVLFEDDGIMGFENETYSTTEFTGIKTDNVITFTIAERNTRGSFDPGDRNIELRFRQIPEGSHIVTVNGEEISNFNYDPETKTLSFFIEDTAHEKIITVSIN